MNYSLSASRSIGDYTQKVIVIHNNCAQATSYAYLNGLQQWYELLGGLDPSTRPVGQFKMESFIENESSNDTDTGLRADVTFTVLDAVNKPRTITATVKNVTKGTGTTGMVPSILAAYNRLRGEYVYSQCYLISAIITLHSAT